MNNEFNSQNNEKVINIAENHGDIIMGGKEPNNNDVKLDIKDVSNSELNINVVQGGEKKDKSRQLTHLVMALFGLLAFFSLLAFIPSRTTENNNVNSTPNMVVNPTTNLQPTITPIDTNIIANQPVIKPNVDRPKPSTSKIVSPKAVTQPKATQSTKVIIKKEPKPKSIEPPNCAFTPQGC
jgi:hypothetical protein